MTAAMDNVELMQAQARIAGLEQDLVTVANQRITLSTLLEQSQRAKALYARACLCMVKTAGGKVTITKEQEEAVRDSLDMGVKNEDDVLVLTANPKPNPNTKPEEEKRRPPVKRGKWRHGEWVPHDGGDNGEDTPAAE